jgi:hypothetical protein
MIGCDCDRVRRVVSVRHLHVVLCSFAHHAGLHQYSIIASALFAWWVDPLGYCSRNMRAGQTLSLTTVHGCAEPRLRGDVTPPLE